MPNKYSFISSIGLLLSFIGMAGLVLSIISLLPLNGYNLYTTTITIIKLVEFGHGTFSQDAKLYLIFLTGSLFSSLFEIFLTFFACCRHQTHESTNQHNIIINEEDYLTLKNDHYNNNKKVNKKSWFIRITCFTLLIQIIFSLFGAHIIYRIKSDVNVIPAEIQYNTFISCIILWINYLLLTSFAFILLFASFFILIGAYSNQKLAEDIEEGDIDEEARPLIV